MSKHLKVDINNLGRDFICSDIHGHFDLLEAKLSQVGFNPEKDRLFSLGDLIDRGPDSTKAFHYLAQPWFYVIIGNHEVMLIDAVSNPDKEVARFWADCGGSWASNLPKSRLQSYSDILAKLPVGIEIPLLNGKSVALVHANLPKECDWLDIVKHLSKLPCNILPDDRLTSELIWSKFSPTSAMNISPVLNIDHVFHGHTIQTEMVTITNRTFMDLGSYLLGDIGFIQIDEFLSVFEK